MVKKKERKVKNKSRNKGNRKDTKIPRDKKGRFKKRVK
jgi:hypothetical protein